MRLYLYIRFSSKRQRDGNSIARQIDYARAFCAKNSIPFDADSQTYTDAGVSGHRGAHRTGSRAGGLAEFLSLCRTGTIPRGSFLLVEKLDRLTREHPLNAMDLLRQLLQEYGITLVVMAPEMRLTADSLGQLEGIICYLESYRGYSESAAKSSRSAYNWKVKRERAAEMIVSGRVPSWCKVVGGKLVAVEAKAAVVREVYRLARRGHGYTSICRTLTDKGVPPISGDYWEESYVYRLLRSRQVLGEYQPRTRVNGRLVPVGDVVPGYYPQVITPEEWADVRRAVASRRGRRGKSSVRVVNLFAGLVWMAGRRGHVESAAGVWWIRPVDGSHQGVRIDQLERCLLFWLKEVRLTFGGDDSQLLRTQAETLEKSVRELRAAIDADPNMVSMLPTLAKWQGQLADVNKKLESLAVPLESSFAASKELIAKLDGAAEEDRVALRRELRQAIRYVVSRVDVAVTGAKWQAKTVDVTVTLRDGRTRSVYYRVKEGRVTESGVTLGEAGRDSGQTMTVKGKTVKVGANLAAVMLSVEMGPVQFPVDPPTFRRRGKPAAKLSGYTAVSGSVEELRGKVREMYDGGKGQSMAKIATKLGIARTTVFRYVHGVSQNRKG